MQLQDIVNVMLSCVSLIVAIIALLVSKRIAAISISTPLVINKLYELVEYLDGRKLGKDLKEDVKRMSDDLVMLRQRGFILRQAGFGERLNEIESKATAYNVLCKNLLPRMDSLTDLEQQEVWDRATQFADSLQALLQAIEPKLQSVFTDPFDKKA